MTESEISEYQKNIEPYEPREDADVTMEDVVVHGLVDECVKIANRAIKRMMYG